MGILLWIAMGRVVLGGEDGEGGEQRELGEYALTGGVAVGMLMIGGVAFGLSSGLMNANRIALEVKAKNSFSKQQSQLRDLLALLSRYHRLYLSLLILYLLSLETVPVLLSPFFSRPVTAAISLCLLLILAHCIPLSWFTGPHEATRVGRLVGVLQALLWLMGPVVGPIAWVLDRVVKREEGVRMTVGELKKSLIWHSEAMQNASSGDLLSMPQLTMLHSLLDSLHTPILLHMIPMDKVFTLTADTLVCEELFDEVFRRGFSRIPLRDSSVSGRVLGVIHVASLLAVDRNRMATIAQVGVKVEKPIYVAKDAGVAGVLIRLLEVSDQMAIIVDQSESDRPTEDILQQSSAIGIITQSDLMTLVLKARKTPEMPVVLI